MPQSSSRPSNTSVKVCGSRTGIQIGKGEILSKYIIFFREPSCCTRKVVGQMRMRVSAKPPSRRTVQCTTTWRSSLISVSSAGTGTCRVSVDVAMGFFAAPHPADGLVTKLGRRTVPGPVRPIGGNRFPSMPSISAELRNLGDNPVA